METNEVLTGGSMNRVIRIADTVHRTVRGHPLLHTYLRYLEAADMPGVPRFLGLDEEGREILTYLPGKTMGPDYPPDHPCLHSDGALQDMARFMRRLHDVSAGFVPTAMEQGWENPYFPHASPETICHGDAAIWNFVFVEDRLAGMFDFDQAYPGSRVWDLTSTVFSAVGLIPYGYAPHRHAQERKRRIRLFFDAYGMACPSFFPELLIRRMQLVCDEMERDAAAGDENAVKMIDGGALAHYQRIVSHIKEHGGDWF